MSKSCGVGSPWAIATIFLGNGFAIASTFSRMPSVGDLQFGHFRELAGKTKRA